MYKMELRYRLPAQVTIDDVVPLLALVESSAFSRDPFRGLGKLTARAVELAFENIDKEYIVEALAKAIRGCGRAHGSFSETYPVVTVIPCRHSKIPSRGGH